MFCEEQGIWINEKSLSHATGFLLYYRGSYPASRANDLSSFTPDPSVVSMSPINSPFTPADSACFCVSLDNLARPPANRMNVRGSMNLKIAIVTKISSSLMGGMCSKGVPGMGFKIFMGTEQTSNSFSSKANSMRCFIVSPIPMIPPEQISIPNSWAVRIVSFFCSMVCVVHLSLIHISEPTRP